MDDIRISQDIILKIKQLWISAKKLNWGIEYAKENQIDSIFIWNGGVDSPNLLDFEMLKEIPNLRAFELASPLAKGSDVSGIHSLTNLERLAYFEYDKYPLDNSSFPHLKYLYTHYSSNLNCGKSSLKNLSQLKKLKLWHVNVRNFLFLSDINSVTDLEITWGNCYSLSGIEQLSNLRNITLRNLKNISDLKEALLNKSIKTVNIETCKRILCNSFKHDESEITHLDIDKIDDLSFIPLLSRLEYLGFKKCTSNDLSPLLLSKSLKRVFFQDAKRYLYRQEDINNHITKSRETE